MIPMVDIKVTADEVMDLLRYEEYDLDSIREFIKREFTNKNRNEVNLIQIIRSWFAISNFLFD